MDDQHRSRFSYLGEIIDGFARISWSVPTASQEKIYEDALSNFAGLISDRSFHTDPIGGRFCQKSTRKGCLKHILRLLLSLQRERLYNPPAEDEIGYYLLIKRYVRSIITFFEPCPIKVRVNEMADHNKFSCYSAVPTLHHMQELSELNRHLADLSVFVSEADIGNGSSVTPLMAVPEKIEVPPIIKGSKEKSNTFYLNRFQLARLDLYSMEFAHCPPSVEEKRWYVQVLDQQELPSLSEEKEVDIYSRKLYGLFFERMEREINDLKRHCTRIKEVIFDKLSLSKEYKSVFEKFKLYCYDNNVDLEEEDLKLLRMELAENCGVSLKELVKYAACVDRCRQITASVAVFLSGRLTADSELCEFVASVVSTGYCTGELGWDILHSLTLLKQGRFCFGTVLRENSIVRISKKRAREEFENKADQMKICDASGTNMNKRVKILRGIIEDLKHIGNSIVELDSEEKQIMHKIWLNVASCIQFFITGIADEQKHRISKSGGLNEKLLGLRTAPRRDYSYLYDVCGQLRDLAQEMSYFSNFLSLFKDGLVQSM